MKHLFNISRSVRNIRAEVDTPMSKPVDLVIKATNEEIADELIENKHYIERFCHTENLTIRTDIETPEESMSAVVSGAELFLPLAGLIDYEKEIARLETELDKLNKERSEERRVGKECRSREEEED